MFRKCTFAFAALLCVAGIADAGSVYSFDLTRRGNKMVDQNGDRVSAGLNDNAGKIKSISGSFDTDAQTLSWSTTVRKRRGNSFDGFWLVINGGGGTPGALGQIGKLGMIYFDIHAKDLTVYEYTRRGTRSYRNGEMLASTRLDDSFVKSMDVTNTRNSRTASFMIDVAGINAAMGGDWMGLAFGEQAGVWMQTYDHGSPGIRYNQDGSIRKWDFCEHGWFDANTLNTMETQTVPTPSAAVAGLAGLGLLASRRKNKAA